MLWTGRRTKCFDPISGVERVAGALVLSDSPMSNWHIHRASDEALYAAYSHRYLIVPTNDVFTWSSTEVQLLDRPGIGAGIDDKLSQTFTRIPLIATILGVGRMVDWIVGGI